MGTLHHIRDELFKCLTKYRKLISSDNCYDAINIQMALDRKKLCPPVLSGVRSHSSSWVELGMVPCPTQMSNTGIKHADIRVQKPFAILSVSNQFLNLIPLKPCTLRVTCYLVIPIDTCQCWLCDNYQSSALPHFARIALWQQN